jgi:ribosomal protein L11 methyltransferase
MPTKYMQCRIESQDEILIALLSEFDFESFEEIDQTASIAYIKSENLSEEIKTEIEALISERNVSFMWSEVEDKNWNEIWESNFQPIMIDNQIIIRADFHQKDRPYQYDIVINPKMAFGTGHHATTYMMMKAMLDLSVKDKMVFDYGCGTGILAIFASMLGASQIFAIDIEEESYLNTLENANINQVNNIEALQGDIKLSDSRSFELILANINKNVLLASVKQLDDTLMAGGQLLLSGILEQDFESVNEAYQKQGLQLNQKMEREGWLCLLYDKN